MLTVYSFIQQTLVEHLLCARLYILGLETEQGAAEVKFRQAPSCYVLFRETVNKQVKKYPSRKRSDADSKQSDMIKTALGRGQSCYSLNGQGGPLGGGDPELRMTKTWPVEDEEALWKL